MQWLCFQKSGAGWQRWASASDSRGSGCLSVDSREHLRAGSESLKSLQRVELGESRVTLAAVLQLLAALALDSGFFIRLAFPMTGGLAIFSFSDSVRVNTRCNLLKPHN